MSVPVTGEYCETKITQSRHCCTILLATFTPLDIIYIHTIYILGVDLNV